MADNKSVVRTPKRSRINVDEDYELDFWSDQLGVSHDELKEAVKQVGPRADAVRQHLGK